MKVIEMISLNHDCFFSLHTFYKRFSIYKSHLGLRPVNIGVDHLNKKVKAAQNRLFNIGSSGRKTKFPISKFLSPKTVFYAPLQLFLDHER